MSDDEDSRTIWCGNLSENVTYDIFYELFLQAGPLEKVRIPRDNEGRQRNFGFVTYIHEESVPYAIDLFQGTVLYDRALMMRMQKPPDMSRPMNNMPDNFQNNMPDNYPNNMPDNFSNFSLPVYPMPMDMPQMDQNMSQQFMIQMKMGMPSRNNYPYNDYPENFGNYDNQHMNTNKLSVASLQGHWSSRSSGQDRDRSSRRHEPYSNRSREEWRSRDGGRDHDRDDRDRYNNENRDRDYRDDHRTTRRNQRQRNRRNR